MIKSFRGKKTESIWNREFIKGVAVELQEAVLKKLRMLNQAKTLEDLKNPPANHLEKLKGDRKDFYSIRVNRQFRICFSFAEGDAEEVELVDYH